MIFYDRIREGRWCDWTDKPIFTLILRQHIDSEMLPRCPLRKN